VICALLLPAWGLLGLNLPTRAQPATPCALAELSQLRLIGSSRYTYWGFDIYSAALWVETGFRSNEPARSRFALELKYLRDFKGGDIARRSIAEMRRVGEFTDAQAQVWLQAMQAAFPDVDAGDRLTGINLPGQGARFLANGRCTAEVNDPEFARLFFGIWLSEKTPETQMRLALLGLNRAGTRP
jgi:Chalcone isomerase-like